MIKTLYIILNLQNGGTYGDFSWINELESNDQLKYAFLCFGLLLIQVILLYENIVCYGEFIHYIFEDADDDLPLKIFLLRHGFEYVNSDYLLESFYYYLFLMYSFETFLFLYPFYIGCSNRTISIFLILILLISSIICRMMGVVLDRAWGINEMDNYRESVILGISEEINKEEKQLRNFHLLTYGEIFEELIQEELEAKLQARIDKMDRDLFDSSIELIDDESQSILDRPFFPGRLNNVTITFCIIFLFIISEEDPNLHYFFYDIW